MLVYLSGVLAGSLWTSVIIPQVSLSGASGGVYALITAHLGTVIMNFRSNIARGFGMPPLCVTQG
jgi:rhomboid-related protein 1/2/3